MKFAWRKFIWARKFCDEWKFLFCEVLWAESLLGQEVSPEKVCDEGKLSRKYESLFGKVLWSWKFCEVESLWRMKTCEWKSLTTSENLLEGEVFCRRSFCDEWKFSSNKFTPTKNVAARNFSQLGRQEKVKTERSNRRSLSQDFIPAEKLFATEIFTARPYYLVSSVNLNTNWKVGNCSWLKIFTRSNFCFRKLKIVRDKNFLGEPKMEIQNCFLQTFADVTSESQMKSESWKLKSLFEITKVLCASNIFCSRKLLFRFIKFKLSE